MDSVVKKSAPAPHLRTAPASDATSTAHSETSAAEHPDLRVPGTDPDYAGLAHHAEESDPIAKMLAAAKSLNAVTNVHAGLAKARVAAETQVLVSSMGDTDDPRERFRFLDSLDRIDDPAIRGQVKAQFEVQTGTSLQGFIKTADWSNEERDKDVALDLISAEREAAENELASKSGDERTKLNIEAAKAAQAVLSVTRPSGKDNDEAAKPLLDALGTKSRVEIEATRKALRAKGELDGEHTSIYAEIDRSLSGGTEDEAVAALRGDRVGSVLAGVQNADANSDRVRELLGRLSPAELKQLRDRDMRNVGTVIASVDPSQREEIGLLVAGEKNAAAGVHIADLLKPPDEDFALKGVDATTQSKQNLENRKPENLIRELRKLAPADIAAAREQFESAHPGQSWEQLLGARDLDATSRLRIQSLLDGDKVGEKALAIRQGMRDQNQALIEGGLSNPGLGSDDALTKAAAEKEQAAVEARVQTLDKAARQTEALVKGADPDKIEGAELKQQLARYYMEYGSSIPRPTEISGLVDIVDTDRVLERRQREAYESSFAATEVRQSGAISSTTEIRRAKKQGDSDRQAELLENLASNADLEKVKTDYHTRYGEDVTANPQQAEVDSLARLAKQHGDTRPLSEIQVEIAGDIKTSTDERITDVGIYGVVKSRDPQVQRALQQKYRNMSVSESLSAEERKDQLLYNRNAGTQAALDASLENLDDQFTPADAATGRRYLKDSVSKASTSRATPTSPPTSRCRRRRSARTANNSRRPSPRSRSSARCSRPSLISSCSSTSAPTSQGWRSSAPLRVVTTPPR